jgi:hypothetical protein
MALARFESLQFNRGRVIQIAGIAFVGIDVDLKLRIRIFTH